MYGIKGKRMYESHIDKSVERMYTLEDQENLDVQGSGLGLTITNGLWSDGRKNSSFLETVWKTIFTCIKQDTV